jgi:CubicO group peptidase (beta-lactamase class C family)
MRVLAAFSAVLLIAGPLPAMAAWEPAQRIDPYLDALARHGLANGSLAISEKGELKYQRAIGLAVIEPGRGEAADAGTRYRIGSVSKLFTAVLAMQLAEGGSITLDGKVAEFFPDLPNALTISYRDLLRHRSGLFDFTRAPGFGEWRTRPHTPAEMLGLVASAQARFPPGERVEYCNSNYLLLGYLVEKVYERPYADILRRNITDRLGFARTYYAGTGKASLESRSYQFTPQGWIAQADTDPSVLGGAGALVSTPADLIRFMDALFGGRLVSAQSLASMRDQAGGSGMGLWPYAIAGRTGYGHGGRIDGFRAATYHFPEARLSIAYATNASVLSMDEIIDEVLTTVFDRKHRPPSFSPVRLTPREQAQYLGAWRSTPGQPTHATFRNVTAPDQPLTVIVREGAEAPVARVLDHDFVLTAFGRDEFYAAGIGYFMRFYPRSGELVVRGPEWSYYFRRE